MSVSMIDANSSSYHAAFSGTPTGPYCSRPNNGIAAVGPYCIRSSQPKPVLDTFLSEPRASMSRVRRDVLSRDGIIATTKDMLRTASSTCDTFRDTSYSDEDDGQYCWVKQTERGRAYLSKRESDAFVIDGPYNGFCIATFEGGDSDTYIMRTGNYTINTTIKCSTSEMREGTNLYIVVDFHQAMALTSQCDFCAVHMNFCTGEVRIESYRLHVMQRLLWKERVTLPLLANEYVNIQVKYNHDFLKVVIGDEVVCEDVYCGRCFGVTPHTGRVGMGVYGRTRAYVKTYEVLQNNEESFSNRPIPDDPHRGSRRRWRQSDFNIDYFAPSEHSVSTPAMLTRRSTRGVTNTRANIENKCAGQSKLKKKTKQREGDKDTQDNGDGLDYWIERDILSQHLDVKFDDIGGLHLTKRLLTEAITLPLMCPNLFTGIRQPWKGILLYGPPGTGKTMLAKAAASIGGVCFFNCSASSLVSKWRGDSEKLVRRLFETARKRAPAIVFFDEIDSVMTQRGGASEHEASRRFKAEFLSQMDGLQPKAESSTKNHVLVLATSNTPWDLDEALRRRLEKRIYIPLPDAASRQQMLELYFKDIETTETVDIASITRETEGLSGADIHILCKEASMMPLRNMFRGANVDEMKAKAAEVKLGEASIPAVTLEDVKLAFAAVKPSVSDIDVKHFEDWTAQFGSKD